MTDSDSVNLGSNPSSPANKRARKQSALLSSNVLHATERAANGAPTAKHTTPESRHRRVAASFLRPTHYQSQHGARAEIAGYLGCKAGRYSTIVEQDDIDVLMCLNKMLRTSRDRAKIMGVPYNLDHPRWRRALYNRLRKRRCEATGMKLALESRGKWRDPFSPSLDQVVAGAGYTHRNIRITSVGFNVLRGAQPYDEFRARAAEFLSTLRNAL